MPAVVSQLKNLHFLDFGLRGSAELPTWCETKEACSALLSARSLAGGPQCGACCCGCASRPSEASISERSADSLAFAVGSRVVDVDGDRGEIVEVDVSDPTMPYNVLPELASIPKRHCSCDPTALKHVCVCRCATTVAVSIGWPSPS